MSRTASGTERQRRFTAIVEPLRTDVYRFALWLARDKQIAQDVVQECLLRAWRSLDSLKDAGAAKHWLLTIARREHARLYERKRHDTVNLDDLIATESIMLASEAERPDDELRNMRAAILELEDDYREPLVLQVLMGYTTEEIASHMKLQQGAVLTRLFRARHRLRAKLGLTMDEPASEETSAEEVQE